MSDAAWGWTEEQLTERAAAIAPYADHDPRAALELALHGIYWEEKDRRAAVRAAVQQTTGQITLRPGTPNAFKQALARIALGLSTPEDFVRRCLRATASGSSGRKLLEQEGREDLSFEGLVLDGTAPWSLLWTDEDRARAARNLARQAVSS